MVSKPSGEMETRKSQSAVECDRVRRWTKEQYWRARDTRPIEMSQRWQRRKNRRAHTGARQSVRSEESTPTAGKMRLWLCSSPPQQ